MRIEISPKNHCFFCRAQLGLVWRGWGADGWVEGARGDETLCRGRIEELTGRALIQVEELYLELVLKDFVSFNFLLAAVQHL